MTNKSVIINSFKVPKIKEVLLYEMKFLVPNYSCLQNAWLGATAPRSPFSLSTEFVGPPTNKIPGYVTAATVLDSYCYAVDQTACFKFAVI